MNLLTFCFLRFHSDKVTHVVSEDSQAASLWKWLRECAPADPPGVHVLDISWFTDSMREGKPVAVETRHLIQVCECAAKQTPRQTQGEALDGTVNPTGACFQVGIHKQHMQKYKYIIYKDMFPSRSMRSIH